MVTWDVWVPYSQQEFLTTWETIHSVEADSARSAIYKWLDQFNLGEVIELSGQTIKARPRRNKKTAKELRPEEIKTTALVLTAYTFVMLNKKKKKGE